MNTILISKSFKYRWHKDSSRQATISFKLNYEGKWVFDGCAYEGIRETCDYDDWDFLHDLSKEIMELCEQEVE